MDFTIIWLLFFAGSMFLVFFLGGKIREIKKQQKQQMAEYNEKCEKYRVFTDEMFEELLIDDLTHAVLFHLMAKRNNFLDARLDASEELDEDVIEDEEDLDAAFFDTLSYGEKVIYTIYQVEMAMEGGRGSIHSFFIDDKYAPYRKYVDESFRLVNCFEIAELMAAAAKLSEIIEKDLDDEVEDLIEGDYATYNFSDYTNELLSILKSSGIIEKTGKYVKDHKEDFVDKEVVIDEERISE